jgi:histidinol-phosphatase (PHP family)
VYDYHVHSTYSDGSFLEWMVGAASDAGLDGVGIADHCVVTPTESARAHRRVMGFNLDQTYERRREAIRRLDEDHEIDVFDAVELDYHPGHESAIQAFLSSAGFDYAIGSVHELDGVNVHNATHFADKSDAECDRLVDRYFEKLVALADSELFEIAAHPDLIERNHELRGYATVEQYERAAAAFADSRTVPEINAGRVTREYGAFHPTSAFRDALQDAGVGFTLGTDSHDPEEIELRADALRELRDDAGIDPVVVVD